MFYISDFWVKSLDFQARDQDVNGIWYLLDFAPSPMCKGSFPNRNRPSFVRARLLRRELPKARGKPHKTELCFFCRYHFCRYCCLSGLKIFSREKTAMAVIPQRMGMAKSTSKPASWPIENQKQKRYHAKITSIIYTLQQVPPPKKKKAFRKAPIYRKSSENPKPYLCHFTVHGSALMATTNHELAIICDIFLTNSTQSRGNWRKMCKVEEMNFFTHPVPE